MSPGSSLFQRLLDFTHSFLSALGRVARALFGELHWSAPAWLTSLASGVALQIRRASSFARKRPRRAATIVGAAALVLLSFVAAWQWYASRPRPVLTHFTVNAPAVTCYACVPPGKPNPLILMFSSSAAPLEATGRDVTDPALIRMSPEQKGQWHWDSDRTLRFQPAADWPVGTPVNVTFARRGVVAPQVRLQRFDFGFTSPPFQARIAETEFHQDPVVARSKKAVVTVTFTHPVDPERFEKLVSLALFEKVTDRTEEERAKPSFTIAYDKLRLNAHIHSGELAIPNKPGRLVMRIDNGVRAARGGNETQRKLETSVLVPGLYSLLVQNAELQIARDERDEPSEVLVIAMNHPVLESDMPSRVHAWRLPPKHPDPKRQADFERYSQGPFAWSDQSVTADVLAKAQPVTLTQIAGEREHYELHSFHHDGEPREYLYVKVDKGLKSFGGYVLGDSFEHVYQVPEYPRELRIAQSGSLLALSGDKTISVLARDIPAMRVEIGRLLPGQVQYLVSQTAGNFERPMFKNWSFDSADLTERITRTMRLPRAKPGAPQYQALSLGGYLANDASDRRGIFFLKLTAWDPDKDQPLSGDARTDWNSASEQPTTDARLIVLTDLGLLAKRSLDGSQDLFVQSIRSGEPLAGVDIQVLGRNGLMLLNGTTDGEGHVRFADLRSFQREQQPTLYLARRGGDSSFLPIEERDRRLDLSRFDVGGVDNRVDQGTLSAYLFSDRGLYRPGEEIRLGAIVRSQDWKRSLAGIPLRLEILDPRGIVIRSEPFVPGPAGFGEARHATRAASPAGTYTVSISIVRDRERTDLIGSTEVQVRDFLPDRLRMSAHFSAETQEGWVAPEDLSARVALQNLFGTPAQNRRVTAQLTLSPAIPQFRAFADFQFFDPQAARVGFSEPLADATTDEQGNATFDLNLQRFERATYRVHIATEGFEADGGRGVSAEAAQLVSNMPYLIGWKSDGDLEYVSRGATRAASLVAIDPRATRTAVGDLKWVRLQVRYISALIRKPNGTYQYESRRKEVPVEERELAIAAAGSSLPLNTEAPGWFVYSIRNRDQLELARVVYHVAGEANLTRTLEKNAELQLTLARHDYAAGDTIDMQIEAPYAGSGLITIERERVYAWRWFHTTTTSSTQSIRLPEGIEGNAYVSVAFVRDPGSDEIYTSPLSYGVQPFSVNLDARRTAIEVEAPELVKPGETLKLKVSSERPSRVAVFAVDEGILQVARYQTPDPLGHFFQKRSLDVATLQILDVIMPEFRQSDLAAAPGGDQESVLGRHLNPFRRKGDKPVAWWSGIIDVDRSPRELEYVVPDYFNGTLRIMAVAVTDAAVGIHESRTLARGDFVLSPNAPTTVTPGDEFEISVGVANNLATSGADARIELVRKPDAALEVLGQAQQTLAIAANHEGSARFRVRARDRLGPAQLEFIASAGAASAHRSIDLSVRPVMPYAATLTAGILLRGSRDIPITRQLYAEHRTLEAGFSPLPLGLAHGLVTYLGHYAYACTEQLVSQAMPALMLAERPEFGYVRSQDGSDLEGLINELRVRQNDAGAYRLWPGGNDVAEFASLYAQHFLLEAAERGQRVPAGLIESGNPYLRALARRDGNNVVDERNSAYAIYLLTRQGVVMSAEAAALRKRLADRYAPQWEQDLAALWLAASFRLMRQESEADRLIARLRFNAPTAFDPYSDAMTRDGFLLFVTARHFPERLPRLPANVIDTLVARITDNSYHSLSAGTSLLALGAYATALPAHAQMQLAIAEISGEGGAKVKPLELPNELMPRVEFSAQASALRFTNGAEFPSYYLIDIAGYDRTPPSKPIAQGFEITRQFTDHAGRELPSVALGGEMDVHVRFRSLGTRPVTQVALVDLLPGGFELVIPRQENVDVFYQASAEPSPASGRGSDSESPASERGGWQCTFCISQSAYTLEYADPREDRVVFYATATSSVQEVVYRIKATNVGTYAVPPAYGEAMYDRKSMARSSVGRIEVKQP